MSGSGPSWGSGWGRGERRITSNAVEWLRKKLEHGPMWAGDVLVDAVNAGYKKWHIEAAKRKLNVVTTRKDGRWSWKI